MDGSGTEAVALVSAQAQMPIKAPVYVPVKSPERVSIPSFAHDSFWQDTVSDVYHPPEGPGLLIQRWTEANAAVVFTLDATDPTESEYGTVTVIEPAPLPYNRKVRPVHASDSAACQSRTDVGAARELAVRKP